MFGTCSQHYNDAALGEYCRLCYSIDTHVKGQVILVNVIARIRGYKAEKQTRIDMCVKCRNKIIFKSISQWLGQLGLGVYMEMLEVPRGINYGPDRIEFGSLLCSQ